MPTLSKDGWHEEISTWQRAVWWSKWDAMFSAFQIRGLDFSGSKNYLKNCFTNASTYNFSLTVNKYNIEHTIIDKDDQVMSNIEIIKYVRIWAVVEKVESIWSLLFRGQKKNFGKCYLSLWVLILHELMHTMYYIFITANDKRSSCCIFSHNQILEKFIESVPTQPNSTYFMYNWV